MQKTLKRILSVLVLLAMIIGSLLGVQTITRQKSSSARDLSYKTFFDNAQDYDVLFLGTSHVMYGVNPLEIWNDYGISSFNLGSATCTMPATYWKLMNVLDYQTPDLVVVDCFRASWTYKTYNSYRLHEAFDAFPLSLTKIKAMYDLMYHQERMQDGEVYSKGDIMNMLLPISEYHSRWNSLEKEDFSNEYVDTKGCEFELKLAETIEISTTTEKTEITQDMQGVIYLRKLIEECQARNIAVLLTYLPFPTDETYKQESNMIQTVAEEYSVPYINFTNLDVVDYQTDYADADSHLNISGQTKVSSFLGKYITENFDIQDRRGEAIADQWNECYTNYKSYMSDFIKAQSSLNSYLLSLCNTDNTVVIDLKDNSLLNNPLYYSLFSSVGAGCDRISPETDFIIAKAGQVVALDNFRDSGACEATAIGEISLAYEESSYTLYIDDAEYYTGSSQDEMSVRFSVTNADTVIDDISFLYSTGDAGSINVLSYNRSAA